MPLFMKRVYKEFVSPYSKQAPEFKLSKIVEDLLRMFDSKGSGRDQARIQVVFQASEEETHLSSHTPQSSTYSHNKSNILQPVY